MRWPQRGRAWWVLLVLSLAGIVAAAIWLLLVIPPTRGQMRLNVAAWAGALLAGIGLAITYLRRWRGFAKPS